MILPELMAGSDDGVLAMDGRQRVIFWNRACEDLTGISASEAVGRHCHEVLRGQDATGLPLCGGDCPVGRLSLGGPSPGNMPMHIEHRRGHRLRLCVGTMLMPSNRGGEWTVVHILSRQCDDSMLATPRVDQPHDHGVISSSMASANGEACLLTRRERQMLVMLAHGMTAGGIAQECHLSVATVRNHIQRMMAKLDVHTQLEAAAYAHRHGLA